MKKVISLILLISILFTMFAGVNVKSSAVTKLTQAKAVEWIKARKAEKWAENYDGKAGKQCVDLIVYYIYELSGKRLGGSAYQYIGRTDLPDGWIYTSNPEPGDIAVWAAYRDNWAGSSGHVALVESVGSGNFNYVDVNGTTGKAGSGTRSITSPNTYIHPDFKCKTHTWNKGKVTTKATCTSNGVKTYTCTVCGETKTETIKGGHKYATVLTVKATMATNGVVGKQCSVCKAGVKTTIYHPKSVVSNKLKVTYNSKYQYPGVTVKDIKGKVISSKYYTVSYEKNKYVGFGKITVKFKGLYSGAKTAAFMIAPKGTALKAVKGASSSAINVYWNKQTTQTSGYQIQYSTNSKFAKNNKVFTSKTDASGKKATGLKAVTKYYFRIRTYKKVNQVPIYSGWSRVLSASTFAPKLTQKKAKALYIKAEDVATKWLFTDAGCYYMSHEYWDDPNTIYNYNGGRPAIPVHHKSIKSVAQLKKYLSNYFTANVYEGIVSKAYRDINGKLYFVAGYGIGSAFDYKLKSVSVNSQKGANATIKVQIKEIDPYHDYKYKPRTFNRNLKVQYVNNKWRFTNPFYIVFCGSKIEKPQWW